MHTFQYFLYFYGFLFDSMNQLINEETYISDITYSYSAIASSLTILDPLNPTNNIGKSSYNFSDVRVEFAKAYERMQHRLTKYK